jgi:predicted MFS family arabinose efflux permease
MNRRGIAVAAAGFATFLNLYTPQAILPLLAARFGIGEAHTSLAVTVSLLAVAVVAPFAGAISDRIGRKRVILSAAAALIIPTLLVASAGSFPALLGWRFAQGLLLPFIFAVTVAYIGEECDPAEALRTTGLYASGTIVGGFFGRFSAGLMAAWAGWRVAFAAQAVLTAAMTVLVALLLPREKRFRPLRGGVGATFAAYRSHLTNPPLLATCAIGFGMLFSLVASFTFINFRLAAPPFGLGPAELGAVFAVYLLGAIAAPLASAAAAVIGRRATIALAVAVGIAGQAITLLPSLAAIIAGMAATCVALFITQALSLSFIGITARRAKSAAVGLYVCVYYGGGALGGAAPIWLWQHAGWPGVVALVAAVMALMAGVAARFWRSPTPSGSPEPPYVPP